jgi:site-specific recombinase XerD
MSLESLVTPCAPIDLDQTKRRAMTLHEGILVFLDTVYPEHKRTNNKSYRGDLSRLKQAMHIIPDVPLAGLLPEEASDHIQKYIDYRQFKGCDPTTIDGDRRTLSRLFSFLIKYRMVSFRGNPAFKKLLRCPKMTVVCKRPLNAQELDTLIAIARPTDIYPFILLALCCGLREIGASRVRPGDVDFVGRSVMVTEKSIARAVPCGQWFCAELQGWLSKNEWKHYHADTISHRLADLRAAHGLPAHFCFQNLRINFIEKLWKAGVAPQMAASLAGNSVEVIQKHYCRLDRLNARGIVDLLDFSAPAPSAPAAPRTLFDPPALADTPAREKAPPAPQERPQAASPGGDLADIMAVVWKVPRAEAQRRLTSALALNPENIAQM